MNVPYNKINTTDAAKRIGVDYATVANWCNKKLINCENISDGTNKARYMITEEEVEYLKELKDKYGTRKILMYYKKDWNKKNQKTTIYPADDIIDDEASLFFAQNQEYLRDKEEKKDKSVQKKVDAENVANTIMYIQDIKERLEDIEAEKAQLLNELRELQKEVMDFIDIKEE